MFEPVVSSLLDTFSGVEDAGVVAAIGVASGEENAACARRLEAMGELYARRAPEDDDERTGWLVDGYESLAAEVAAELGISRGRATRAAAVRNPSAREAAAADAGVCHRRYRYADGDHHRQPGGVDHRRSGPRAPMW